VLAESQVVGEHEAEDVHAGGGVLEEAPALPPEGEMQHRREQYGPESGASHETHRFRSSMTADESVY